MTFHLGIRAVYFGRTRCVSPALNRYFSTVLEKHPKQDKSEHDVQFQEAPDARSFHDEETFTNQYYVKLSPLQKSIIAVGSGLYSFFDPTKAENIATFGEVSAGPVLMSLHRRMMASAEGSRILIKKPLINSNTVDLEALSHLPDDTLGRAYLDFLNRNQVTPDSRLPVRFIEDNELAYVMQRYREIHDLVHTVCGQPTNMLGEVVVKWIEGIQTGLPMCLTGGLFGATRLRPKQRKKYVDSHLRWAIDVGFNSSPFLNIFYEERWEQPLDDLRREISPYLLNPPA